MLAILLTIVLTCANKCYPGPGRGPRELAAGHGLLPRGAGGGHQGQGLPGAGGDHTLGYTWTHLSVSNLLISSGPVRVESGGGGGQHTLAVRIISAI